MSKHRASGFTLIELMIAVVIVGVLAGIAYPSYQNYTRDARRTDAQTILLQLAGLQEKFFSTCASYSVNPGGSIMNRGGLFLGCSGLGFVPIMPAPANILSADRHYLITITPDNSQFSCAAVVPAIPPASIITCGYTITADPNGAGTTGRQANNGQLTIDSTGLRQWDRNNDGLFAATENTWRK